MNEPKKKFWTPLRIGIAIFLFALSIWTLQFVAHLEGVMSRNPTPSRDRGVGNVTKYEPHLQNIKVREPAAILSVKNKKGEKACGVFGCTINTSCVLTNSGDKDVIVIVKLNVYDGESTISETKKVIASAKTAQEVPFTFNRQVSESAGFNCEFQEQ